MWGSLATAAGRDKRREEGLSRWLSVRPCEGFLYCEIGDVRHERVLRPVKTRNSYFVWVLYLSPLIQTHCILINPPWKSEREESKCTWQSGRGHREAVGVIKSDLATDPPSQLQTGDLRRQVEPTIGSLLLSEEWTCASVSACLFLNKTLTPSSRLSFFILMEKTIKRSISLGHFIAWFPGPYPGMPNGYS